MERFNNSVTEFDEFTPNDAVNNAMLSTKMFNNTKQDVAGTRNGLLNNMPIQVVSSYSTARRVNPLSTGLIGSKSTYGSGININLLPNEKNMAMNNPMYLPQQMQGECNLY